MKATKASSDEILMEQLCAGNRPALELLYERYFNRLVLFALQFLKDEQLAEDAAQESFIRIIRQPELYDRNKKFGTWIYTITANICRNMLRDESNRARIIRENIKHPGQVQILNQQKVDLGIIKAGLAKGLENLSEKENTIFLLRFSQELSIKEIAEITGLPEGSVKSGLFYTLKKLGRYLKEFI